MTKWEYLITPDIEDVHEFGDSGWELILEKDSVFYFKRPQEEEVNITKEIHHIDNNISIIKQQTNEKVNIVDTYTASELEQFFTNRYNESKN
jgi:hypothetical protein